MRITSVFPRPLPGPDWVIYGRTGIVTLRTYAFRIFKKFGFWEGLRLRMCREGGGGFWCRMWGKFGEFFCVSLDFFGVGCSRRIVRMLDDFFLNCLCVLSLVGSVWSNEHN